MNLKFAIGDRVFKKKPCASLRAPNWSGTVVDFVEKPNRNGARTYFYVVKVDKTQKLQEWAPGITCLLSDQEASKVAFKF